MKQVEVVEGYQWDPEVVLSDWKDKVLPHLPRTALLPAVFAENPDEEMFTYVHRPVINPILKGTVFEEVLTSMPFKLNRAVFIYIPEGMCLRHHTDPDNKYHLSVVENQGSFYYDYNTRTGEHLPADGKIRRINSAECHHTAVNGGVDARVHLVMTEYECETTSPTSIYTGRMIYDYSECNVKHLFTGKRDLGSTIEQNMTMVLTNKAYSSKKMYKMSAHKDGDARVYEGQWTSKQAMYDLLESDEFWKTEEALKEFNIKLKYEID